MVPKYAFALTGTHSERVEFWSGRLLEQEKMKIEEEADMIDEMSVLTRHYPLVLRRAFRSTSMKAI